MYAYSKNDIKCLLVNLASSSTINCGLIDEKPTGLPGLFCAVLIQLVIKSRISSFAKQKHITCGRLC